MNSLRDCLLDLLHGSQEVSTYRSSSTLHCRYLLPSNTQDSLRVLLAKEIKAIGPRRNPQDNATIEDKRSKLQESIDEFWRTSHLYLPALDHNPFTPPDVSEEWVPFDDTTSVNDDPPSFDDDEDDSDTDDTTLPQTTRVRSGEVDIMVLDHALPAEQQRIPLPSSFGRAACGGRLKQVAQVELSLRKGQANDALHALRLAIGKKSFVYWSKIRKGSTGKNSNYGRRKRNSTDAQTLEMSIDQSSKVYMSARRAMAHLGASEADLDKYQILRKADVSASTAIVDFNAAGQRNKSLSWIWHAHRSSVEDPTWLKECKHFRLATTMS